MTPYALIDLAAIAANYRLLAEKAAPARCGAAVKANAYGLGMVPVADALRAAGCQTFFTAHYSEAATLRQMLGNVEIIVLHGIDRADFKEALAHKITPMINHLDALQDWALFARQQGASVPVMIHLDTGMNRLGLSPSEQEKLAAQHEWLSGLEIKAWASHFACADEFDNDMTTRQRDQLAAMLKRLPSAPVSLCNSSGIFWGKDYLYDLARPGIALYGGNPTPGRPNPMQQVITLRSPILQLRDVDAPMTVGYAASYHVKRKGRIATIALGYADGYHRTLSNKGMVMIGEHAAPIAGRVSMDLITIDVTDVPESALRLGADVTLIGPHRSIDQVADEAGTIPYEILTSLGSRIERRYG